MALEVRKTTPMNDLLFEIYAELEDFNEDTSAGEPRYEIHAENMAGLLEKVLKVQGCKVPEVPEW